MTDVLGQTAFKAPVTTDNTVVVTNADHLKTPLTINRTDPATATTDNDTFVVNYMGERATWANEKGNLRTSNQGSPAEDALKITGHNSITGNYFLVQKYDGTIVMRVGALGRTNFNFGMRLVGDTFEIRDSTEVDTSTISQPLGGALTVAPKTSMSLSGKKITSLADPTSAQDAATKNYVDTRAPAILVGTTAPSDLTAIWIDTN
jgi:hypothetical protein